MRIVALVKSPEHVCCRYRLAAFRPALEQAGHRLDLKPWPRSWLSRLRVRRLVGPADVLILQRKLPPLWQLPLLRRVAPRLVFDFDDAVFLRDSYSPKGLHCPQRARAFAAVVRTADAVVAGNSFLRAHAALWSAPEKVYLIPTCVDLARYPLAGHAGSGAGVRLAWIGSASTLRGLEQARPLLEHLGRRRPGVRLKIICDRFLAFDHLLVESCPWSERTETAELAAADIGLSWLPDDLWSRGKCCLKVLQYMAAGLPVVANPVGMQAQLVRHGETGFLVNTAEELAAAVGRLADDPDLRRRLGQAGRRQAQEKFNISVGQSRWTELLTGLARREVVSGQWPGATFPG